MKKRFWLKKKFFYNRNWKNVNYTTNFPTKNFNASIHSIIFNSKLSCKLKVYSEYFIEKILSNWIDDPKMLELIDWTIIPPIFFVIILWFASWCTFFIASRLPRNDLEKESDSLFWANHSLSQNKLYLLKEGINHLEEARPDFPWRLSFQLYFAFSKKVEWLTSLMCYSYCLAFVLCLNHFRKLGAIQHELSIVYITKWSHLCYILSYITFTQLIFEVLLILLLSIYFKHTRKSK